MIFTIVLCFALGIFPTIIIGAALSPRYGSDKSILAVISVLLGSIVVALITREVMLLNPSMYEVEYDENQAYPIEEWRKVDTLKVVPDDLEYRSTQGLFAITEHSNVKIKGDFPACLGSGELMSYRGTSMSLPISVTTNPRIQLPPPPHSPLHQITFDFPIQLGNTDILGVSSFAVYENGEVWCSEQLVQRGQSIGVGLAFGDGLNILFTVISNFIKSFVGMTILAIAGLEFLYRRSKSQII